MGQADPQGRIVTRPIYCLRKDFDSGESYVKRLEQIVNRKPSARLRLSAKENIVSVLFIFTFTVVNRYY